MTDTISVEGGVTVESFDGKIESAYGRPLNQNRFEPGKPVVNILTYSAEYEKVMSHADIPADELPNQEDVLNMVNAARKANARQKAIQKAYDVAGVIKPTLKDDVALQIAGIAKSLVASGRYTPEQADEAARKMLTD